MNKKQIVSSIFLGLLCMSLVMPTLQAITTRKDALIEYVKSCDTGSGFTNAPEASEVTLESTFQALYILNANNDLGEIDEDSLIEWVNSCKNTDYGFGNRVEDESDIISSYYACWIFDLFDVEMYNYTYFWVADLQNGSAGFADNPTGSENVYATFFGIEALTINGTDLSNNNVSIWLVERQNINPGSEGYGGFATEQNSSNMWATWAAIGSISRLNVLNQIFTEPLVSWLNSSQNLNSYDDNFGAFSSKPGESDYGLLSTHAAIYCLQKLGSSYLSRINLEAALSWLLDLQNEDGGFRVNSIDAASSLSASYYAFAILDLLGERNRLESGVPWETGFQMPLWGWILIGIAIILVAILVIKKYYID